MRTLHQLKEERNEIVGTIADMSKALQECKVEVIRFLIASDIAGQQARLIDVKSQISSIQSECDYLTKIYEGN